jgi:hypothetical protein
MQKQPLRSSFSTPAGGVNIHFTAIDYSKIVFHERLQSWAKQSFDFDSSNVP